MSFKSKCQHVPRRFTADAVLYPWQTKLSSPRNYRDIISTKNEASQNVRRCKASSGISVTVPDGMPL